MANLFLKILNSIRKSEMNVLEQYLLNRSFKILSIQAMGLILVFTSNLLLARLLGESSYGIYSLISNWVAFIAVITLFGIDDSHAVRIPSLKLNKRRTAIQEEMRLSVGINAKVLLVIVLSLLILIHLSSFTKIAEYKPYLYFSLVTICFLTFFNNFICLLRALDKVVLSEVIDKIIRPLSFLLLLLFFYYCLPGSLLAKAIIANSSTLCCVMICLIVVSRKYINQIAEERAGIKEKKNIASNIRYTFLNLLYMLSMRADILILGILSTAVSVGHYNIAMRFSDIFAYPLAIVNLSLPSLFSKERYSNNENDLPRLVNNIAKTTFFQCLLLGCLVLFVGSQVLGWYGKGFTSAYPVLFLFLISNLISAFTGSIDVYFILHAEERKVIYSRIVCILVILSFAFFLIPEWGIIGAALAALIGNITYCGLLELLFYKKYRVFVHPFHRK